MPLIIPKQPQSFEKIYVKVPTDLLEEIKSYCKEFSITEVENFFNEAAKYVLKMDKDWQKILKKK